jgi:hypothetical protein
MIQIGGATINPLTASEKPFQISYINWGLVFLLAVVLKPNF